MLLPPAARAVTLEVTAWQVAVRIYLHGTAGLEAWEPLDDLLAPLVLRRLPARPESSPEAWQVLVQAIRRDRPEPLDVFGTPVWVEDGTRISSVNLVPQPERA